MGKKYNQYPIWTEKISLCFLLILTLIPNCLQRFKLCQIWLSCFLALFKKDAILKNVANQTVDSSHLHPQHGKRNTIEVNGYQAPCNAVYIYFFTNWQKKWGVLKSVVAVIEGNFSEETCSVEWQIALLCLAVHGFGRCQENFTCLTALCQL